jgi:hypothetical protein
MLRLALALALTAALPACGGATAAPAAAGPTPAEQASPGDDKEGWAKAQGLELKKFDLNRDEHPDIFKFYRAVDDPKNPGNRLEQLVRKEIDINHDGKIDVVQLWNADNEKTEEHTDLDFDGRIDEIVTFDHGLPARKSIDLDYDGKPDVTKFYADGRLQRIESDRDGNHMIDTWEYYESGELDRIGVDSDGDGEVDQWERKREAAPAEPTPAAGSGAKDATQEADAGAEGG